MPGKYNPAPVPFNFAPSGGSYSGFLAFGGAHSGHSNPVPLLFVTCTGTNSVHIVDVVEGRHEGYVVSRGEIPGPRGVATRGTRLAVSCWTSVFGGDHVVRLFEGSGTTWRALRQLGGTPGDAGGKLHVPWGLRFTADGTGLAVAEGLNGRVSLFHVEDGSFVKHVATELLDPFDVEEGEAGWLVACKGSRTVVLVSGAGAVSTLRLDDQEMPEQPDPQPLPVALAVVPGVGLVVREEGVDRVRVFQRAFPGI